MIWFVSRTDCQLRGSLPPTAFRGAAPGAAAVASGAAPSRLFSDFA